MKKTNRFGARTHILEQMGQTYLQEHGRGGCNFVCVHLTLNSFLIIVDDFDTRVLTLTGRAAVVTSDQ